MYLSFFSAFLMSLFMLSGFSENQSLRVGSPYTAPLDPPETRAHHSMIYDETSQAVFMLGGSSPYANGGCCKFFNDIWSFDGQAWVKVKETGPPRSGVQLAYRSTTKELYAFGGYDGKGTNGELRKLIDGEWVIVADMPELSTTECGLVYDIHRDVLVLFGGSKAGGEVHDKTWEWDGSRWQQIQTNNPPGRQAFAMVYDSARRKTVLFGGMGKSPKEKFRDTWEYDGKQWLFVDSSGPSPRMGPGATYDLNQKAMIIFGGMGGAGFLGDTWSWDGVKWSTISTEGPKARIMGNIAFDKKRGKTVLFGGRAKWPGDEQDTWEWDGHHWAEIK